MGVDGTTLSQRDRDRITHVMGGVYDVHFVCIQEGCFPDTQMHNETVMRTFAKVAHIPDSEVDKLVKKHRIDQADLLKIGKRLAKKL